MIGAVFLGKVRMRVRAAFHSLTPLHAFRTRHGTGAPRGWLEPNAWKLVATRR